MKNYKLLVFDWDGTLIDSKSLALDAIQKAATELGEKPVSSQEFDQYFGLNIEIIRQQLYPKLDGAGFLKIFYQYYNEDKLASSFFPGAVETLKLFKQEGRVLTVATNRLRARLDYTLNQAKITDLFRAIRCPDNSFPKPHPEMLLSLLDELMFAPEEALMIGDTIFDMQFAANAGVDKLAVGYGHTRREQLSEFNPIGFLEDIRDLKQFC